MMRIRAPQQSGQNEVKQMKQTLIKARPLVLLALLAALAACGTIDGIGRDISGASNRVSTML